jgi:hypothetical protein
MKRLTHRAVVKPDDGSDDNPVTAAMQQQWHKLCAMAIFALGAREVTITAETMVQFDAALGDRPSIVADFRHDTLTLRLVNAAEATTLAGAHQSTRES